LIEPFFGRGALAPGVGLRQLPQRDEQAFGRVGVAELALRDCFGEA
jgi:hypothetical protein